MSKKQRAWEEYIHRKQSGIGDPLDSLTIKGVCLITLKITVQTSCNMSTINHPACGPPWCDPPEPEGPNHGKNCMKSMKVFSQVVKSTRCVSPDDPRIDRWQMDKEKYYSEYECEGCDEGDCGFTYTRTKRIVAGACNCIGIVILPAIWTADPSWFFRPTLPPYACMKCDSGGAPGIIQSGYSLCEHIHQMYVDGAKELVDEMKFDNCCNDPDDNVEQRRQELAYKTRSFDSVTNLELNNLPIR